MTDNASQAAAQVAKKSKFEEMTGVEGDENADEQAWTPRVVYTRDVTPDFSSIDIPRLRLAQGMTAEVTERKAQIGQYVLTNFPAYDTVTLVPLASQKIRVYAPDPKARPQCTAPTGVHGIGNPGIVCAECPLSKWGPRDPKTGKATKPPCNEGISVRAYSVTHKSVVDFQFMGRSISTGAFIQQQAMANGYAGFAVELSASTQKNDRHSWVVPSVQMLPEVPEDHKEIAEKWYEALLATMPETQEEALRELSVGGAS